MPQRKQKRCVPNQYSREDGDSKKQNKCFQFWVLQEIFTCLKKQTAPTPATAPSPPNPYLYLLLAASALPTPPLLAHLFTSSAKCKKSRKRKADDIISTKGLKSSKPIGSTPSNTGGASSLTQGVSDGTVPRGDLRLASQISYGSKPFGMEEGTEMSNGASKECRRWLDLEGVLEEPDMAAMYPPFCSSWNRTRNPHADRARAGATRSPSQRRLKRVGRLHHRVHNKEIS